MALLLVPSESVDSVWAFCQMLLNEGGGFCGSVDLRP